MRMSTLSIIFRRDIQPKPYYKVEKEIETVIEGSDAGSDSGSVGHETNLAPAKRPQMSLWMLFPLRDLSTRHYNLSKK